MKKSTLTGITEILPFDGHYIKVGKGGKWNLADAEGKLVGDNWFSSISRNADGSIVTETRRGRAKPVKAKFIDVKSLVQTVKVMDVVPLSCIGLMDSGSIVPLQSPKYVAKAMLYGMEVFVGKDGSIYDKDGTRLRVMFNTVDSERIFNAIKAFNHKLNYNHIQITNPSSWTFNELKNAKIAMWAFYWVNDDTWCVNTAHTSTSINTQTKRWTDGFMVRIIKELVPETVRTVLDTAFGEHKSKTSDGIEHWTWCLAKGDLEKLIDTLGAF